MADNVGYSALTPILNPNNNVLKALDTLKYPKGVQPIALKKLHCTLMYDERNNIKGDFDIPPEIYHANVMGVAVLGKAVVLLLSSDEIMRRHFQLLEHGFKYSFENYAPHLSIVYADKDAEDGALEAVRVQVQALLNRKLIPNQLYFTDEFWKPCD